jgi:hypothetical protein
MHRQPNEPIRHHPRPRPQRLDDLVAPALADKTYYGRRKADGSSQVWVVDDHSKLIDEQGLNEAAARDLPLRLDIRNHSPTGSAWGYGGSGPAQLALALLADALGDDTLAEQYYQEFKREVVAGLGVNWQTTAKQIREFVALRRKQ